MRQEVLWRATADSPRVPATPWVGTADVAVIGGGYTGLAAARNLAASGIDVVVLEARTIGWGASSRNGGMVTIGSKRSLASWVKAYGRETAQRLWGSAQDAVTFVEQLIAGEGIACDWERSGFLNVAWRAEHFGLLAEKQRVLAEVVGHQTTLVPPKDLSDELASAGYHGALIDEFAGGLHPAKYVAGLAAAGVRAGAVLQEGAPVRAIERSAGAFVLTTAKGTVRAGELLVATNGYSGSLVPEVRASVIPVGSQVIATAPLSEQLARELIPRRRMVFDTKNLLFYFRLTPDNRFLFGGRAAFRSIDTRRSGRMLRSHMVSLFPQLADVPVEFTWDGLVGYTLDRDPNVGRADGLYYALGYCGHGVALGTYLGHRIADYIKGGEPDVFVNLRRPPALPFYRGRPWFMPAGAAFYRLMDRLR